MSTNLVMAGQNIEVITTDDSWLLNRDVVKETIQELVADWRPKMGLANWSFYITFNREKPVASCEVLENYWSVQLNFYLKRIEEDVETNLELEELVVHEMAHVLVWDLATFAEDYIDDDEDQLLKQHEKMEERLVTNIGRGLVMAKYGLTEIPDSLVRRLCNQYGSEWEAVRGENADGEIVSRGVMKAD